MALLKMMLGIIRAATEIVRAAAELEKIMRMFDRPAFWLIEGEYVELKRLLKDDNSNV